MFYRLTGQLPKAADALLFNWHLNCHEMITCKNIIKLQLKIITDHIRLFEDCIKTFQLSFWFASK